MRSDHPAVAVGDWIVSQISLDARKSQRRYLRELPRSLPTGNGLPQGPWSGVPLWRGLNSDFLCSPEIPKAPAAPRLRIEMVGNSLRISDEADSIGLALGDPAPKHEGVYPALAPQNRLLLLCALVGFLGGIISAWFLGALR
jgi:hypothetical protein